MITRVMAALALALAALLCPLAAPGQMEGLYRPMDAGYDSVTSWNHRYPGVPFWVPETIWQETFNRKYVELEPGETYTLADLSGPGIIVRLFFTLPVSMPRHNLRGLVLRIYWDGEDNPSVVSPLGDFFGAAFGKYRPYDSAPMSMQGAGFVCRFHMPFHRSARIEVENGWDKKADLVFFGVHYYKVESLPADAMYFHAHWRRQNPTEDGEPYLVADFEGRGSYVGVQLYLQNLSTFWNKDLYTLMQPEGFGMGNLEGWEAIEIDGELVQHGTGTEEYFAAGAYFSNAPYSGMYEGVHVRDYLTGRTGLYRFHISDPIPFRESFKMIWRHGPLDSIKSDYASIAYWYQTEPHKPHDIPGLEDRIPEPTGRHAAQAVFLAPLVFSMKAINDAAFKED